MSSLWCSGMVGIGVIWGVAAAAAGDFRRQRRRTGGGASARRHTLRRSTTHVDLQPSPVLEGPKLRVVVFGGTGYIGRAVVKELSERGHSVVVPTRERSGIGGTQGLDEVKASFGERGSLTGEVDVVAADVAEEGSLAELLASLEPAGEAAVCCLASRTGGREDSFKIDYEATVNCMTAAKKAGFKHFVLLSAVCVQRPKLAFQEAKLKAEAALKGLGEEMSFSIVQPTAYFKSFASQIKRVKEGGPYLMFGDGTEVRCKPISEEDLASFVADCLWDPAKRNAVLPVGGPGDAISFREQGELMFELIKKKPYFFRIPFWVFGVIQAGINLVAGKNSDTAEYARIGRYYAEESMLVFDSAAGRYSGERTPSYGKTSLQDFIVDAMTDSAKLEEQKVGEQGLAARMGLSEKKHEGS